MSHLLFHLSFVFHHSRGDPALSVFASKCQGECYALTAALCDLGDPGWGGSLVSALSFVASITLLPGPFVWFCVFFVLLLVRSTLIMTHKMSSCMLFPLLVAIPLLCVLFVLVWLWLCVFCLLGFFCFWLWFWFLAGTARWTAYRSTTSTFVAIDK